MATATLMTVEEFAALPEDGLMHELVEGELLTMPPPHSIHARIANRIFASLTLFLLQSGLGEAFAEAGYQLEDDPATVRQPDVSFLSAERLAQQPREGYFRGSADLVFEIVSPSDKAADLDLKTRQYLAAGSKAVVIAYPRTRSVWVHRLNRSPEVLTADRTLEVPDVLPGWSLPVQQIFAPLDAPEA
ncbi:MAG: Uma2 family endonuclease [Bryobacterales bacterium]|nr:Uma2 family endonuclease [Bryobacterales bacterium]